MSDLTLLPLGLPGNIYRSPMPYSYFDRRQSLWEDYQAANIHTVVMLAERHEAYNKTGRDLVALYPEAGFNLIYYPIVDFDVPTDPIAWEDALGTALKRAQAGRHVVVHCLAGLGRTGLFVSILAGRILGLDGPAAIEWVRQVVPGAVQTEEQAQAVFNDRG